MLEEGLQVNVHIDRLKTILKKIANCETLGLNGFHGFCFKKFTPVHNRLATERHKYIQKSEIPEWMTKRKSTLIQKDRLKGTVPNKYRPITCLPMMWKILRAKIREKICYILINHWILSDKQKGYRKRVRGTEELIYIYQHILNESKTRRENLAMAWIDYKKAYDMVPQSCLKMYKYPTKSYSLSRRPYKHEEWNWQRGNKA